MENITKEYKNRYNDVIVFSLDTLDNKVYMRGHSSDYMRYGLANEYTEAYLKYVLDGGSSHCKLMGEEEFVSKMENDNTFFNKYAKLIRSSDKISMVDPSGGPYIELESNLAYYLGLESKITVKKITIEEDEIIFDVEINDL